ncbi:MAG: hypothetical protein RXQ56_10080, partial [Thermoproteus sp.]
MEEVGRIVERWRRRAKIRGWFVGEDRVVLFVEDPAEVPADLAAELEAATGRRVEVVKGKIYLMQDEATRPAHSSSSMKRTER